MPDHLRAYVFVMAMAIAMFFVVQKPVTSSIVTREDFKRRRMAWLVVTTSAFVAHNYWVYMFATCVTAWLCMQRERNPMALFVTLLFCVPLFKMPVPGLGIVNYFFDLDSQRVLALVIMLPMAFRLIQSKESGDGLQRTVNFFVLCNIFMMVGHLAANDSPTATMRLLVEQMLTIWLTYYVSSRGPTSVRQLREVMLMFVMVMCIFGLIAAFESARSWHLYNTLRVPLGVRMERLGTYILRESGDFSLLRAITTGGGSIMLGQTFLIAICFWVGLRQAMMPLWRGVSLLGFLVLGIAAALSRGPWIGAIVGVIVITLTGPGTFKRVGWVFGGGVLALALMMITPWGNKLLDYLPFVGTAESGNVDYRVQLYKISMLVFWENPLFGSYTALLDHRMEELRQGQGLIDLVNHYLGIALFYGLVGLFLFVVPFLLVVWRLFTVSREVEKYNPTVGLTGRAMLGAMVGTLFTIATTSVLEFMTILMWLLLGLSASYITHAQRVIAQHKNAAAQAVMYAGRPRPTTTSGALPGALPAPARRGRRGPLPAP